LASKHVTASGPSAHAPALRRDGVHLGLSVRRHLPARGTGAALVMPVVSIDAMNNIWPKSAMRQRSALPC